MRGTEFEMLHWNSGPGNLLAHALCQTAGHPFYYSLSLYEEHHGLSFQVLTALLLRIQVVWNVMLCSWIHCTTSEPY